MNIEEGEEKCRNPQHTSLIAFIHVFQKPNLASSVCSISKYKRNIFKKRGHDRAEENMSKVCLSGRQCEGIFFHWGKDSLSFVAPLILS